MIRAIIVDDHPVFRAGQKQVLSDAPDILVKGEVESGESLLQALEQSEYDVVILDITLPGMDGLETLQRVKQIRPDLPVLIVSMHPEEHFAVRALKSGASGYLSKESTTEELVEAVRKVASGNHFITATLAGRMAATAFRNRDIARLPHEWLSKREFQVFRLIADGKPTSDIAVIMNLSAKTVSTYRARILDKMGMESNAELTVYAVRNNLV